jgi:transposase
MYKYRLAPKERADLVARHRKERDKKVCDRIKAVLAYDDGYSYSEIAKILLLDDETIRRHIDSYFQEGKLTIESGGNYNKFSKLETKQLIAHLQEVTYLYVKDICHYVKKTFGKTFSISGMTKWLHNNGFAYKKPHAVPAKANVEQQQEFIEYYNKLKATAGNKEPIYFADSVHPQHQTKLAYGWILTGQRKEIPTNAKHYRLNFIGGICLHEHRLVYEQADQIDANAIAGFLVKLRNKHPEKHLIHLIWDNAGYHKDKTVQEFANSLGIKLHYLPPYSPNLNPIERLWKIMHEWVTYNKYYEKFADFTEAITNFFKTIGRKKRLLRSRITDNFQKLDSVQFAF